MKDSRGMRVEPALVAATEEVMGRVDRSLAERMLAALVRFYRAPPTQRRSAQRDLARELAHVALLSDDDWVLYAALSKLLRAGRPTLGGLEHPPPPDPETGSRWHSLGGWRIHY